MSYYTAKKPLTTDRPEWTAANNIGMAGEAVIAAVFRNIGLLVAKMQDRRADLEIGGKVEVKHDRQAHRTGCVAVETRHRDRASGISNSIAGCWAFVLRDEIFLVATDRLRAAVAELPDVAAGEGAMVRLLPVDELRRVGVNVGGSGAK